MKINRKYGVLLIALLVLLAGCQQKTAPTPAEDPQNEETLHIVTTIFPAYDWAKEVVGEGMDHVELSLLTDTGVDLHSFQPTSEDMMKITHSDIFIYVGGESDDWVEDVLVDAQNKDLVAINLMEILGDKVVEEEMVEGMEAHHHDHEDEEAHDEHEAEHDHENGAVESHDAHEMEQETHDHEGEEAHHEDHDHEHEDEYDEHVWLSLKNAKVFVSAIAEAVAAEDPANAEAYQANAKAYQEQLSALDAEYQAVVDGAAQKTLLFGDRFPFRYLVDDYGLTYFAAFSGCSAESEASFETITFLAKKVDELSLKSIMTLEKSDGKIAATINENTEAGDKQILCMNSMQSFTKEDLASGISYLSIMENNRNVLKEALQ